MANYCVIRHHGILGQKWGTRNGPPYPLAGGDYTQLEKKKISQKRRLGNSIYNKKHFDQVIKADKDTLRTLSYDADRTKNADMFYATYKSLDKHQYNALFNKKIPQTIYDENGKELGTGSFLKYKIDNKVKKDIKVASEDSGSEIFANLYKNDRDFYNFVSDKSRLENYFDKSKYKFKGYQEGKKSLDKLHDGKQKMDSNDVESLYRMFNYVIPNDGRGNARAGKDIQTQRTKFFNACKEAGYGAVLDTNDAIYGGFKASAPVIVFDMNNVVPKDVKRTTMNSKRASSLITTGRKILGV